MEERNLSPQWHHTIIASFKGEEIKSISRAFNHEVAGILHNVLRVILNDKEDEDIVEYHSFTSSELWTSYSWLKVYEQYDEYKFLETCLSYFNQEDVIIDRIDFKFINTLKFK